MILPIVYGSMISSFFFMRVFARVALNRMMPSGCGLDVLVFDYRLTATRIILAPVSSQMYLFSFLDHFS